MELAIETLYRVVFTGWKEGLQKVSLVELLRKHSSLSLTQAKKNVDCLVDDIQVVINCLSKDDMYILFNKAEALGVICEIMIEKTKPAKDLIIEQLHQENLSYKHNLNVGQLKEFLIKNNVPDSAKVLSQRIEDTYYDNNSWSTVKKKGERWHYFNDLNKKCEGEFLDKEQYPLIDDVNKYKTDEKTLNEAKEEFSPVWCCVKYENDDNLYLHLHI
jgi:hypothetical protein